MPEPTSTTTSPNTQEGSGDDKTAAERPSGAQDARASQSLESHGNSNTASEKRDVALDHVRKALDAALPDVQLAETKNGFMLIVEEILKRSDKKQDAISAIVTLCQCLRAEPGPLADLSQSLDLYLEGEGAHHSPADDNAGKDSRKTNAGGRFSFRATLYNAAASALGSALYVFNSFAAPLAPGQEDDSRGRE